MKKFAILMAAATLAGCGLAPDSTLPSSNLSGSNVSAQSTGGLETGWTSIHQAIFNKIDVLHQGYLSEDEAGPYISLTDFLKADVDHNDRLDFNEFMSFATQGGFLQANDSPSAWITRMRGELGSIFKTLDTDGDGWLEQSELSSQALARIHLAFYYPNLHITVNLPTVTPAEFSAADHLGTHQLSQAEFEDLYVQMVVDALNPPAPAPAPAPASASKTVSPAFPNL
ncbi:MAG: hypothetical protein KGR26_10560 [Cyanobacteria bacterium REEB65]|nr:hypothetical protein [Cyanobacteria bacterium REEB65]